MSIFNKAKSERRKAATTLAKAARDRGMTVEELAASVSPRELLALSGRPVPAPPPIDVTRFGLPPHDSVTHAPVIADAEVQAAVEAVGRGEWRPAAELMASTRTDWDRRAYAVRKLAGPAAVDDSWLVEWRAERPGDPDAAVVHAQSLVHLAWNVRGSQAGKLTTREQFAGFRQVLVRADAAAREACALLPDDPTPLATRLNAARGLEISNEAFEELWQPFVAMAPHHRIGYDHALQYWCEKWFGSHELMFAFADAAAQRSPRLAALPIRAAYEYAMRAEDDSVWQSDRIHHAVDATVAELATGAQWTLRREDVGLAAYGLVATGRAAAAIPLFVELGTSANVEPYTYFGDPIVAFNTDRILACRAVPV